MEGLRNLLSGSSKASAIAPDHLVYVRIPGETDPEQRGTQYENPLDAELQLAGLGGVSGGGTGLSAPDADDNRTIEFCGIDVDTHDVAATRDLLRHHLPLLDCPADTEIEFEEAGVYSRDIFDGREWRLAQPAREPDAGD